MVVGPDTNRKVMEEDHSEIRELLISAFGQSDEADLVERLRADGEIWLETVKPWDGIIAGYAALSRMRKPVGWACLAPVAVLPKFQNGAAAPNPELKTSYSFGTRLVSEIAMIASETWPPSFYADNDLPSTIVVVGKKSFFERTHFSSSRAQKLDAPFPLEHTLIARSGSDIPTETLKYPLAFEKFGR